MVDLTPRCEAEKDCVLMFSQSTEGLGAGHGSISDGMKLGEKLCASSSHSRF